MIQRIQTVYLLLAFLSGMLLIFVPLGSIADVDSNTIVNVCVKQLTTVLILNILSCLIAIVSIFLFRNYKFMMSMIRVNLVLGVIIILLLAYDLLLEPTSRLSSPGIGLPLPLFTVVFNFLALKGVKHDDSLIRSYDRLR